jgi:hypothetical protein
MTVKELTLDDLVQLVMNKKATTEQKKLLSKLLDAQAEDESKAEFQKKIDKVKKVMEQEEITIDDLIKSMKEPQTPIFIYLDKANEKHEVYGPMRGREPTWLTEMKKELTKEKALEMALSETGKQWIEKIYAK